MVLNPDFREWAALLAAREVRYLVVGGYAVAAHGHPRYTDDLDLWVDRSEANAGRLLAALQDFGFEGLGLSLKAFMEPDRIVQRGRPPGRIGLMTSVAGVAFGACWLNRFDVDVDGLVLPLIGLDDLRANKRAVGRYQDLADLENLEGGGS